MRVGFRHRPRGGWWLLLILLITGCSKPEEVISRRLTQANQNLDAGRVEEAVKTLERLNQTYADQPAVLEALGFAYARAGQHTAAAASFVRAADVNPESASLRQLAADSYFAAGEFDRAAQQYRLYVDEFPGDYRAREKIGQIEERNGDLVRALDQYIECYRLNASGDYAWRIGNVFRRLRNGPQTRYWFEQTIKHGDGHVEEALLGLLELEINAREYAAAERTLDQLDRIYPGTVEASPLADVRNELAEWREQQNRLAAARTAQQRAAREIEEERRRREAELAATAAPSRPPEQPPPPPAATETPVPTESLFETASANNTALPESPVATRAPASAARTPSSESPPPTAEPTPEPATAPPEESSVPPAATGELATPLPDDVHAALAFKDRGSPEQAIGALWTILANDDDRVDAWYELGLVYRDLKQYGDAESCLLEAARRAPDDSTITVALLEVARESQPRDVYLARVEEARRKFPANAHLAYFFARELAAIEGAAARAASAYEDFLLLAPEDDPRRAEASAYLSRVRGY